MDRQTVRNDFKDAFPGVVLGAVLWPFRRILRAWDGADNDTRVVAALIFLGWVAVVYFEHEKAGRREWAEMYFQTAEYQYAQARVAQENNNAALEAAGLPTLTPLPPLVEIAPSPEFNSAARLIELINSGVAAPAAQATVRALEGGHGGAASFTFTVPKLGAPRLLGLAPGRAVGSLAGSSHPCASMWGREIEAAGAKHNVDPKLILEFMGNESACLKGAISVAGAQGLMQIMPATGMEIAPRCGEDASRVWEPATNISLGACYIRWLADTYRGGSLATYDDVFWTAVGYNSGPGRIQTGTVLPETGPYARAIAGAYFNGR